MDVATGRQTAAVTDVVLAVLNSHGTLDELPLILSAVRLAVGADVAGYYIHEMRGWSTAVCIVPDEAWAIVPFARIPSSVVVSGHPGIRHLLTDATDQPFAVTDIISDRGWQNSEMVSLMRADWGRNYQFAIPASPGTGESERHVWVLGRFRHNFTNVDRDVCQALAPVLDAVTRHRAVLSRLRSKAETDELLTQRELVVLRLTADGLSALGIATRLSMSPRTAQKHAENIYRKLGVHSRHEAVRACELLGISSPASPTASR